MDCVLKKNVSYADHLTKFKLVSALVDTKIKEDIRVQKTIPLRTQSNP